MGPISSTPSLRTPYILTPPASQTATNGNNATFTVTAGGQPPFSYRWLFNGTNLPAGGNVSGTTSNLLTITSVSSSNAGNYSVLVTNSYGSVTSSVATLTVVLPPSFSTQPTNLVVPAGQHCRLECHGFRRCTAGLSMASKR